MDFRKLLEQSFATSDMVVQAYLGDLSDADLLVRPVGGANHIAWQLGHLIVSEHEILEAAFPGQMPALPAGFAERYTPATAKLDSLSAFDSKETYLKLAAEQRAGTLKIVSKLSAEDLDKPGPEKFRNFLSNVAALFLIQPSHWMMHAGQWAVVRRKLGRKPLF